MTSGSKAGGSGATRTAAPGPPAVLLEADARAKAAGWQGDAAPWWFSARVCRLSIWLRVCSAPDHNVKKATAPVRRAGLYQWDFLHVYVFSYAQYIQGALVQREIFTMRKLTKWLMIWKYNKWSSLVSWALYWAQSQHVTEWNLYFWDILNDAYNEFYIFFPTPILSNRFHSYILWRKVHMLAAWKKKCSSNIGVIEINGVSVADVAAEIQKQRETPCLWLKWSSFWFKLKCWVKLKYRLQWKVLKAAGDSHLTWHCRWWWCRHNKRTDRRMAVC